MLGDGRTGLETRTTIRKVLSVCNCTRTGAPATRGRRTLACRTDTVAIPAVVRPTGLDAAVRRLDPPICQRPITERAAFCVPRRWLLRTPLRRLGHQLRSRQNRNSPTPSAKKRRNRAKKRGPIIAEIKKNNLIELIPPTVEAYHKPRVCRFTNLRRRDTALQKAVPRISWLCAETSGSCAFRPVVIRWCDQDSWTISKGHEHGPSDQLLVTHNDAGSFLVDQHDTKPQQIGSRTGGSKRIPHGDRHRNTLRDFGRIAPRTTIHSGIADSRAVRRDRGTGVDLGCCRNRLEVLRGWLKNPLCGSYRRRAAESVPPTMMVSPRSRRARASGPRKRR